MDRNGDCLDIVKKREDNAADANRIGFTEDLYPSWIKEPAMHEIKACRYQKERY